MGFFSNLGRALDERKERTSASKQRYESWSDEDIIEEIDRKRRRKDIFNTDYSALRTIARERGLLDD